MSKLYFVSDVYTVAKIDKIKELKSFVLIYEDLVDHFKMVNGDFIQLTYDYVKSRMIYNGQKMKPLPPDEDFLLYDKFPFNQFVQFSDIVSFDPRGKGLKIVYDTFGGYAVASNDTVRILYVLKTEKKVNFEKMDLLYSYGEDFIYYDFDGLDLTQLVGNTDWLFKTI